MKNGDYNIVIAPPEYPGKKYRGRYCYEHRLVFWQTHGRLPDPGEVVHHKDEDKRNNVPKNLEDKPGPDHTRHHHKSAATVIVRCHYCGKEKVILKRKLGGKKWAGLKYIYCDNKCQAKKQFPGSSIGR